MKQKKRFIAGATCPQCKTEDALQWWMENSIELVECVECGFHEQRKPKSIEQSQHANEQMIGIFKPE